MGRYLDLAERAITANADHLLESGEGLSGAPGKPTGTLPRYKTETVDTSSAAHSAEEIELALRIGAFLETLPGHQSVTASEIAEKLYGGDYTLNRVLEVYQICEALRASKVLILGRDGYGYQLCCWAKRRDAEAKS